MNRTIPALAAVALLGLSARASAVTYNDEGGYGEGGVTIRMHLPEGSVLNPGEEVAFRFQTREDAYVIVFNIDTQGYVHLLHPEGNPAMSAGRRTYDVPEGRNSSLLVSGETGVEFVFALTIPDLALVDQEALAHLRAADDRSSGEPYRIDGDPFVAANLVAAELVRGISRREGVYLDYTHFYINERVDYPCYLCGTCEGDAGDPDCASYRIVADFPRDRPLAYPLRRGYAMVDREVPEVLSATDDERVVVEFYPYSARTYGYPRSYVYRAYDPWYYDPWYWDPWYYGWSYYPYSGWGWGWGISVGWGWGYSYVGWGWGGWWGWGGYYCSSWYYPCYPYYGHYPGYGGSYYRPDRFKSKYKNARPEPYKGSELVNGYRQSVQRDASRRVAAKDLRRGSSRVAARDKRTDLARSTRSKAVKSRGSTRLIGARHIDRRSGVTYERRRATVERRSSRDAQRTFRRTPTDRSRTGRSGTRVRSDTRSGSRSKGVKTRSTSQRRSSVRSSTRSSPSRRSAVKSSGGRSRSAPSSRPSRSGAARGGSTKSRSGGRR
jgi:hypothetical protein